MQTEASSISSAQVMAAIDAAGLPTIGVDLAQKLADYGNLLLRWNARTNLTSIRTADGILQRHLVECVAAARILPVGVTALLDYGSGAGLPGIPIALVRPEIKVMLAESQSRKVAFLREAVRTLGLNVSIHPSRVDALPSSTLFDCVTLRAVDNMAAAIADASTRLLEGGWLVVFATEGSERTWNDQTVDFREEGRIVLPSAGYLVMLKR